MSGVLTPSLLISRSTRLVRRRELPVAGKLLVSVGDSVLATSVVARADLDGDLTILRIAEKMGIEPFEVERGLRVREGDGVREGDILCEHAGFFGLFTSRFSSPLTGVIELVSPRTGHVGIRTTAKPFELSAYIDGRVVEVVEGRAVILEREGPFLQGIFGIGGERIGRIARMKIGDDEPVTLHHLPEDCRGLILAGGQSPTGEVLQEAARRGAVGLVTASVDDAALRTYLGYDLGIALTGDEPIPMSMIMTEGFGRLRMNQRASDLLGLLDGCRASLNGATQVRAGAVRPELIPFPDVPLDRSQHVGRGELRCGASVRLIRVPYFGAIGEVTELPHAPAFIPTGARTRVVTVRLTHGDVVTVPRANVEIIEGEA